MDGVYGKGDETNAAIRADVREYCYDAILGNRRRRRVRHHASHGAVMTQSTDSRMTPKPLTYHGPGWEIDLTTRDEYGDVIRSGPSYYVWAPQDGVITDPHGYADHQAPGWEPRAYWQASWQSADGNDGNCVKGESAEVVLAIFGPNVRALFARAIDSAPRP